MTRPRRIPFTCTRTWMYSMRFTMGSDELRIVSVKSFTWKMYLEFAGSAHLIAAARRGHRNQAARRPKRFNAHA